MPVIPQLQRQTVQSSPQIVRSGVADISGVGRAVESGIREVLDVRDQYQLDKAAIAFTTAKRALDRQYEQSQDYKGMESSWTEEMDGHYQGILEGISNPRARSRFDAQYRPRVEAGRDSIRTKAWGVEVDHERNEINGHLNAQKKNFLTAGTVEDAAEIAIQVNNLLDSAANRGFIDHERAGIMQSLWEQESAGLRIEAIPKGEDMLALIQSPLGEKLSGEQIVTLTKQAQDKIIRAKAEELVNGMGREFTRMDLLDLAEEAEDPRLREQIKRYGSEMHSKHTDAEIEEDNDTFQAMYQRVIFEGEELDTRSEEFVGLNDIQKNKLLGAQSAARTAPKHTNFELQKILIDHTSAGNFKAIREILNDPEKIRLVKPEDRTKYWTLASKGMVPEEYETDLADEKFIKGVLSRYPNIVGRDSLQVLNRVTERQREVLTSTGKRMSDAEVEDYVRNQVVEVEVDPGAMFRKERKRYYQLTPEERDVMRDNTLEDAKDAEPHQLNMVINEVLDDTLPDEVVAKALRTGASHAERIDPRLQKKIVERLTYFDPRRMQEIGDMWKRALGDRPFKPMMPDVTLRAYADMTAKRKTPHPIYGTE